MPNLEILCDEGGINTFYNNRLNHEADSGVDLYVPEDVSFEPGETKLVNLKIKCRMVDNTGNTLPYYLFSRSSIYKTPLLQANCTGIIDKDYRGHICVALRYIITDSLLNVIRNQSANLNEHKYILKKGTRIVQICEPTLKPITYTLVDQLDNTERGSGGFGSTGV